MKFPNRYWLYLSDRYSQRTGVQDLLSTHLRIEGAKKAALDAMEGERTGEFFQHTTMQIVDTHTGVALTDFEIFAE